MDIQGLLGPEHLGGYQKRLTFQKEDILTWQSKISYLAKSVILLGQVSTTSIKRHLNADAVCLPCEWQIKSRPCLLHRVSHTIQVVFIHMQDWNLHPEYDVAFLVLKAIIKL